MFRVKITSGHTRMHDKANKIVTEAKTWLGVRFRHQGRSRETGVDCAGLLVVVAQALELSPFDNIGYSRRPNPRVFRQSLLDAGCTPRAIPEHGDIVRLAETRHPVHTAIYEVDELGEWIIHAYLPLKKVVREALTTKRKFDIREVMRFPE